MKLENNEDVDTPANNKNDMKDWENVDAFSANDTRQAKKRRVCVFQSSFPVIFWNRTTKYECF